MLSPLELNIVFDEVCRWLKSITQISALCEHIANDFIAFWMNSIIHQYTNSGWYTYTSVWMTWRHPNPFVERKRNENAMKRKRLNKRKYAHHQPSIEFSFVFFQYIRWRLRIYWMWIHNLSWRTISITESVK